MEDNYTHVITVDNSPEAAYRALTSDFDKWWTNDCDTISNIGDKITFHFGPTYWIMRADKLVPNRTVELKCIDAHHVHDGLPSSILREWKETTLKWTISEENGHTDITLVHEGLIPSLDCYDVCEQGWDYFFSKSLKRYLDTGEGSPFNE